MTLPKDAKGGLYIRELNMSVEMIENESFRRGGPFFRSIETGFRTIELTVEVCAAENTPKGEAAIEQARREIKEVENEVQAEWEGR